MFGPKTSQKPFQNEVRDLQKSMLKTPCFSTSIFSRLGLDFGASLASKIEPSSPFWPQKTRNGAPFEPSSIKCLLKMASWRPRASNLEPLGSILEGFGLDFEILECSKTGFERPWTYFGFVFWKTCGSHIWGHLLTIVGMPSLPFHFILFLSVPFHYIACHSIPFHFAPFQSVPFQCPLIDSGSGLGGMREA